MDCFVYHDSFLKSIKHLLDELWKGGVGAAHYIVVWTQISLPETDCNNGFDTETRREDVGKLASSKVDLSSETFGHP